jgi:hypothetical protein
MTSRFDPGTAATPLSSHIATRLRRLPRVAARARRELIASSPDLQERDLIKMASLAAAIARTLGGRRVPSGIATFAAQAAVAVFTAAYDDWADDTAADFAALMQRSLSDLRRAIDSAQAATSYAALSCSPAPEAASAATGFGAGRRQYIASWAAAAVTPIPAASAARCP